jgi:hypothetical protein
VKEVSDMDAQRVRDVHQVAEFHLGATLHPLDRAAVQAAGVGEGFLGHVEVQPPHSDAVADGLAGVEDPLRLIGWHPSNGLTTKIISQQQICGIF